MRQRIVAMIMMAFIGGLAITGTAMAHGGHDHEAETGVSLVAKGTTVDSAFYGFNDTVTVHGVVKGDVFCAGQNITIDGTVEGDVICAGQSIKLLGTVEGDVRLAGQNIVIDGNVRGSVSVIGQSIDIMSAAVIGRDLNGAGQNLTIAGSVGRDIAAGGNQVTIDGQVGRNLNGSFDTLTVTEGALIKGNATVESRHASIADGIVQGETKNTPLKDTEKSNMQGVVAMTIIFGILTMLAFSLLLVALLPRVFSRITRLDMKQFWLSALIGLAVAVVLPIFGITVAMTLIGLPFALLIGLLWLIVLLLSTPVFSFYIGRQMVAGSTKNVFLIMIAGSLVVLIAMNIPLIGILVWLITVAAGSGMILKALAKLWHKPDYTLK